MRTKIISAFIVAASVSPVAFAEEKATSTLEASVLVRGQKDGSDYSISVTPRDTLNYAYNATTKVFEITNAQGTIPLDIKVAAPAGFDAETTRSFKLLAKSKDGVISKGTSNFTIQPIIGGYQLGSTEVDLMSVDIAGLESFDGVSGNSVVKMGAEITKVSTATGATLTDMSKLADGIYQGNILVDLKAEWTWGA
ncbi:hypothetical protein [Iodobacter fluviatilis]|uniref:Uncharacterized protein n=1 Tax=Iodobacter fluviatilis TaxID=537 RepID=A0A7G3GB81_9NEIS|nr:hypothetical protein [Iodobacter fluviatilis]QBC44313.1 hypothetical protein C1H71_12770 [Iodobacter fluviatilis]